MFEDIGQTQLINFLIQVSEMDFDPKDTRSPFKAAFRFGNGNRSLAASGIPPFFPYEEVPTSPQS